MRIFSYLLAFALLLIGTSVFSAEPPQSLSGGLERVPDAKVSLVYSRPDIDWSKYKTIQIRQLEIPSTVRNAAPSGETTRLGETYVLSDKDVATVQKIYDEAMRAGLSRGGFTFVDVPQADTLIIAARITDIKLNAPIESSRTTTGSRNRTYSRGAGSMAIAAVFADGASGQVLAEAADRKYSADIWSINDSANNLSDAKSAFRGWANQLRDRLIEKRAAAP